MHTEHDTQTVTNTLALYGVTRRPRAYYAWYAVGAVLGTVFGTAAGHLIKGTLGL